ncbi:hypothetical protein FJZ53_02345 [Candidatus Woesearchaeota archaeon]|nr:hypothetical protein [Candidatus Woesearchaeota archaeon]
MKKIIPIIGICSMLYFSGINSTPAWAKSDYLEVKNGKGHVYTVSENEGNKQLREIAKTTDKEDGWVYAAGKWYDVGESEKEDSVTICLKDAVKYLKKHKGEKEAKFAHVHPKKTAEESIAPPSSYDIFTHGKLKRMLKNSLKMSLISEAHTSHGVWTYDITDALEKDINNAKPGEFNSWRILESMINQETILIFSNKSSSNEEKIEHYISAMKNLGITVSYKTSEK